MKKITLTLTEADVRAMSSVWNIAVESSCSCGDTEGKGYLFHDKGCHVHIFRKDLERVAKLIDNAGALQRVRLTRV